MLSIDNTLNSPSAAAMKIIPSLALPLSPSNNNSQKLNYENDNTYQTEELGILDKLRDFVNRLSFLD